jgi:hypothetical protein
LVPERLRSVNGEIHARRVGGFKSRSDDMPVAGAFKPRSGG